MMYNKYMNRLYESSNDSILIGWVSDGGYGCHPGLINSTMSGVMDNIYKEDNWWETTSVEGKMPDALICFVDRDGSIAMEVKGVDSEMANSIMSMIGGNHMNSYDEDDMIDDDNLLLVNDVIKMVGFIEEGEEIDGFLSVSVVTDLHINHIYWSDIPESHHEPWRPPYKEIHILEEFGFEDWEGNIEGIDSKRLLNFMISRKIFER